MGVTVIVCVDGDSNEDALLHHILRKCSVHYNNLAPVSDLFPAGLWPDVQTPKGASIRIKIDLEVCTRTGVSKLINVSREAVVLLSL